MKIRYIVGIVLFIGLSVFAVLRFGIAPRPIGIMKPSFFDRPEEIGAVVYRRLYDPVGREPLIVFGVLPEQPVHREVVEGFLATAHAEHRPIQVVFKESRLDDLRVPAGTEVIPAEFNGDSMQLAAQIRERTAKGERVLLYTASILSSHLLKDNPMHRFEQAWKQPVMSITTVGIPLRREQEFKMEPPCVGSERDGAGTADLGCAALLKGRQLYRKRLDNTRLVALMDQRGRADLLLFISVPTSRP